MKTENQIIELIARQLPRSKKQVNKLFESDAEILSTPRGNLLFSVDDYSKEDHFRTDNPFNLGWNLTVATLSDIFASGGIPSYFAHAVVLNSGSWNSTFVEEFTKGIGSALHESKCYFLGGDFGFAHDWHYTGIVMGKSKRILTREGTKPDETILMTGSVGAGNIEAAATIFNLSTKIPSVKFELRKKEAKLISKFATACIDSSDGFANSLNILAEINNAGFKISNYNYHRLAEFFSQLPGIPVELLLLGECGEYELIFTIDTNKLTVFLEEANDLKLHFTILGKITSPDEKSIQTPNGLIDLKRFNIRGRDFQEEKDYISSLIQYLHSHGIQCSDKYTAN